MKVNALTGIVEWERLNGDRNRKYVSKHLSVTLRHTMDSPGVIEEATNFNILDSVKFAGSLEADSKYRKVSINEEPYDDEAGRRDKSMKVPLTTHQSINSLILKSEMKGR